AEAVGEVFGRGLPGILLPNAQLERSRDEHLVLATRFRLPPGLHRSVCLEPIHDQLDLVAFAGLRDVVGIPSELLRRGVGASRVNEPLFATIHGQLAMAAPNQASGDGNDNFLDAGRVLFDTELVIYPHRPEALWEQQLSEQLD